MGGSGAYDAANKKQQGVIRYDYFETPVNIGGRAFIATFDVEVYPYANNYRTHKVVKEINLTPVEPTDAAPEAAAFSTESGFSNTNIPQNETGVNAQYAQGKGSDTHANNAVPKSQEQAFMLGALYHFTPRQRTLFLSRRPGNRFIDFTAALNYTVTGK